MPVLTFLIDDLELGTGDALDEETENLSGFENHLKALEFVMTRARTVNLRFKLSKCSFAQFSLPTLGLIAGCGVVSPDPAKRVTIDL